MDTRDTPWGPPPRQPAHARRVGKPSDPPPLTHRRHRGEPLNGRSGGAEGNERLTALTGAVLLVLLAAEGVTLLQLGRLITVHFFIGMLLLGPVVLKAGAVIYRFIKYYTGSAPYRRKGPPAPLLRLLGPLVIASTAGVFGSGIALAFAGPGKGPWLFLHKGSFVVWFCVMTVHVLWYLPRIPRLLGAEFRGTAIPEGRAPDHGRAGDYGYPGRYTGRAAAVLGGRGVRLSLLVASLLAGLVIAMLTVHLAVPWHFAHLHN